MSFRMKHMKRGMMSFMRVITKTCGMRVKRSKRGRVTQNSARKPPAAA